MKKIIIAIVILVVVGFGAYLLVNNFSGNISVDQETMKASEEKMSSDDKAVENKTETLLGTSAGGRIITAYHYGTGTDEILFVGGIHGGYGWNTSLVAYNLMDYLKSNPGVIPANIKVTVVPVLNPDGLSKVVATSGPFVAADVDRNADKLVAGRFNADNVDLNRNFDCDWQSNAKWQDKNVSGGSAAFSEPEALGIKSYIESAKPKSVVVWYAAAGGVFASNCHNGILPETSNLVNVFAKASGYPAHEEFNFYETTGDMTNWLTKIGVPSVSVLLTNHTDTEWSKNQAGILALFKYYSK